MFADGPFAIPTAEFNIRGCQAREYVKYRCHLFLDLLEFCWQQPAGLQLSFLVRARHGEDCRIAKLESNYVQRM
jgi:hypothetical protein